jgi:secreted PhoX family phosphatase
MNRRHFFKTSLLSSLGVAFLGLAHSAKSWAAALVKMKPDGSADHPQASSLGYVADLKKALADDKIAKAAKLDVAKKKSTKGKDGKPLAPEAQDCAGCQFYTGAKGSKEGPCTLIPGVLVHAAGSCNTWVPKG